MKNQITNIGVLQSGKITAALYGAIAAMIAPFVFLASVFGEGGFFAGIFMVIFMVVIYPLMGFVGGLIVAAVYNFLAGIIGGIEITLEPVGEEFNLNEHQVDEPTD